MTYVNRFDQRRLAWSLVDVAAQHLVPDDRAWLCVKIGAGDVERALIRLVGTCMRHQVALPADVEATLRDWLPGYSGTEVSAAFESYIGRTGRDGAVTDVGFAPDRMLGGPDSSRSARDGSPSDRLQPGRRTIPSRSG